MTNNDPGGMEITSQEEAARQRMLAQKKEKKVGVLFHKLLKYSKRTFKNKVLVQIFFFQLIIIVVHKLLL